MPLIRFLVRILARRGTPRALALGVATGVFVAFTPTPFQMVIAAALATPIGANRPAAILLVWITNPLSMPVVYAFTYWVGQFFWSGPPVGDVYDKLIDLALKLSKLRIFEVYEQWRELFALGRDIFIPMIVGGLLVGILAAFVSYPIAYRAVKRYRRFRRRTRKKRRKARLRSLRLRLPHLPHLPRRRPHDEPPPERAPDDNADE